jgi:Ca2+-binding EF-hand superfamily protein
LENTIGEVNDQFWAEILVEVDKDNDEMISLAEFIDLLTKKKNLI